MSEVRFPIWVVRAYEGGGWTARCSCSWFRHADDEGTALALAGEHASTHRSSRVQS